MVNADYYLSTGDGLKQGPFLANEILAMSRQGLLSPGVLILDEGGQPLTSGDLKKVEPIPDANVMESIPAPPSVPERIFTTTKFPRVPFISRRYAISVVAFGLLQYWLYLRRKDSRSQKSRLFQYQRPPATKKE